MKARGQRMEVWFCPTGDIIMLSVFDLKSGRIILLVDSQTAREYKR